MATRNTVATLIFVDNDINNRDKSQFSFAIFPSPGVQFPKSKISQIIRKSLKHESTKDIASNMNSKNGKQHHKNPH